MKRMCARCNITFEETRDIGRLALADYDILWANDTYVDPANIPPSVRILYGPQFFVFPTPNHPICGVSDSRSERAVFNILSDWVIACYKECVPEFRVPLVAFPFGVDTERFCPAIITKTWDCLVYVKRRSAALVQSVLQTLDARSLRYKVFTYGSYDEETYRQALQQSAFMIVLDAHESQGFALQEAMSCGVPLLVVDATSMYDEMADGHHVSYAHMRPKHMAATSVPYWGAQCGLRITDPADLNAALHHMQATWQSFTPRDYVLDTLSDEVCMRRLLGGLGFSNPNLEE